MPGPEVDGRRGVDGRVVRAGLDFLQEFRLSAKPLDFLAKGLWEVASAKKTVAAARFLQKQCRRSAFLRKYPRLSAKTLDFLQNMHI